MSDESHCKPGCSQLDVGDVVKRRPLLRISRLTNADEANEVQENAVTAKKGKKRSINAITSFQVNNP